MPLSTVKGRQCQIFVKHLIFMYILVSATQSSTFSLIGQGDFNISYVDNTGAVGDYFQDSFGIGDATLSGFEMGLALQTTIGIGIMGIGYNTSEANTNTDSGGNGTIYQNLPFALVSQGQVKSPAYSLWLNDLGKFSLNPYFLFT